jgi:hypothetical protein
LGVGVRDGIPPRRLDLLEVDVMGNLMVSLCARKDGRPFFGANLYFKDRPSRNIEERMFTRQIEKGEVFLIDDVEAVERVEAELDAFILKRCHS